MATKQEKAFAKALRPSVTELVDAYAKARAAKTAAEKEESLLRKQLVDQFTARGTNRLEGAEFEVTRSFSSRELLDGDAVRSILTPAQIEAVTKTIPVANFSVAKLDELIIRSAA